MPTIDELGKRVKDKYPGEYDQLTDAEVGRRIKQKYPGVYDQFTETEESSVVLREHARRNPPKGSLIDRAASATFHLLLEGAPSEVGAQIGGITAQAMGKPRPLGESIGGMAGETFRQLFMKPQGQGVDYSQIIGAGMVAGPVRKGVSKIPGVAKRTTVPSRLRRIKTVKGFVPGGGVALLEEAREEIDRIPSILRRSADDLIQAEFPGETALGLRAKALRANPDIPTMQLRREGAKLVKAELDASQFGAEFGGRLKRMAREIQATDTGTLGELNIVRRNLGGLMQAAKDNSAQQDAISDLLAGLFRDVEKAAELGVPGAKAYMVSLGAFRREMAATQFEGVLNKVIRPVRGEDFHSLNISRLYDQVEKAFNAPSRASRPSGLRLLPDVVNESEKKEILDLLKFWNENLPALPTRIGVNAPNVGSGQVLMRGGVGALGAMAANQLAGAGVDPTTVGIVTGAASGLIGNMMMSPRGRQILRQFIARGGPINFAEMAIMALGQGVRVQAFNKLDISRRLAEPFRAPELTAPNQ